MERLHASIEDIGPVPAPSTGLGGGRFSSTGRSSASTEIGRGAVRAGRRQFNKHPPNGGICISLEDLFGINLTSSWEKNQKTLLIFFRGNDVLRTSCCAVSGDSKSDPTT